MHRPAREVFQAEALGWLASREATPVTSVVTSLPDVSEVPALGFEAWRAWFVEAARAVLRWVPASGVSIFFQSDIRRRKRASSYFGTRSSAESPRARSATVARRTRTSSVLRAP
jgi:hypothetical protein